MQELILSRMHGYGQAAMPATAYHSIDHKHEGTRNADWRKMYESLHTKPFNMAQQVGLITDMDHIVRVHVRLVIKTTWSEGRMWMGRGRGADRARGVRECEVALHLN